jgi:hypothetical protein
MRHPTNFSAIVSSTRLILSVQSKPNVTQTLGCFHLSLIRVTVETLKAAAYDMYPKKANCRRRI